jgi:hypothetical protein
VALADLDGVGGREFVFGSFNNNLYALNTSGTLLPGFPKTGGDDFRGGPVIGDLDNDVTLEIVAGNWDGNLYVYNHDGSNYVSGGILATLPDRIGAGAALCNIDADPELEIIVGCFNGTLYAYNHDGSSFLPGQGGVFAALTPGSRISASPIVVDVDGDSDFEIFLAHRDGKFYGFHHDGTPMVGLPIPTGDQLFSTPAAGDLDNDGDIEVAFASYDASVHVLDYSGPSIPAAYQWATLGGNNHRTATYGRSFPYQTGVPNQAAPVYRMQLSQNVPNPFASGTSIRFVSPYAQQMTLRVFDITGRLVRTLVDGEVSAGPNEIRWDGRDARGQAAASGIYFYQLDGGERSLTRKGVLLR